MALSVEEALGRILSDAAPLATETVPIEGAAGRVLAAPLAARLTQPPFDASSMDGYAVRLQDVSEIPVRLRVIGAAAAGHPFSGQVGAGEAVRIFTGAPVPAGSDAIVIQENTDPAGEPPGSHVEILSGRADAELIRRRGFDFAEGTVLLEAGQRLGPREITIAAAMGYGEVPVRRRPVVAVIATGDELVAPGTTPAAGQIVCSNSLGVAALLAQSGAETRFLGIVPDRREALAEHIGRAREADVLVTIGGASVGDHDLVGPVLRDLGMALEFWTIAMRPGKPLLFGRLGRQRVVGLPGNPVSSIICARVFVVPLVRALLGLPPHPEQAVARGALAGAVEANGPREHYMRASLVTDGKGRRVVSLARSQDSSLLSPLVQANALLVRPAGAPALPAGTEVEVLLLDF